MVEEFCRFVLHDSVDFEAHCKIIKVVIEPSLNRLKGIEVIGCVSAKLFSERSSTNHEAASAIDVP